MSTAEFAAEESSTHDRDDASVEKNIIDSSALLQGRTAISILHNDELYSLRLTRQGKLILTK